MEIKNVFKMSALAAALSTGLTACGGGDIVINSTDNSSEGATPVLTTPSTTTPVVTTPAVEAKFPATSPISLGLATKDATLTAQLGQDVYIVQGELTEDVTLHADVLWALDGAVFVGKDIAADGYTAADSATLTIQAGVTVFGRSGSDFLVISRGSKIEAIGTATNPVVMTSFQDVSGVVSENDSGLWGGVVINGQAPNSKGENVPGEANSGTYGGNIDNDNSGTLKYLQVRFGGFKVDGENELNGIAFQSVGSGTVVDYVQVHNNSDDGVEFFGGSVNAKHLVLTGNQDDSLDWTQGWRGKVQHVFIKQNNVGGDHGFEGDGSGGTDPNSDPQIANITFLGSSAPKSNGLDIRKGSAGEFYNFLMVAGNEKACLDLHDDVAIANSQSGELDIQYSILDCQTPFASDEAQAWFEGEEADMNMSASSKLVNYMPIDSSPALGKGYDVANNVDSFFDSVDYVGAFDGSDDWTKGWTYGIHKTVSSCPDGTTQVNDIVDGQLTCAVSGVLTSNVTLAAGAMYQLTGAVFVGKDIATEGYTSADSATLTIQPGVTVFGQSGADYLVVSRGSKLQAVGSVTRPVIMTSASDVRGTVADDDSGLWGGVVINGQAPNSKGDNVPGEANTGTYGGAISDDNSGALRYLQVKYAGFKVDGENELNGIAFQSVGSGTEVDYVQVHNNSDDGVEFFGGTVNVKHLVLTGNQDDSLDWTQGWNGNVQYVLIKQNEVGGDHGLEGDGSAGATPNSKPNIANLTFIGSDAPKSNGMDIRKGSEGGFYNWAMLATSANACLDIDDEDAKAFAVSGELAINTSVISCVSDFANDEAKAWFEMSSAGNASVAGVSVDDNYVLSDDGGVVASDMTAVSSFFDATDYVGAVKDSNDTWWKTWTFGL